MFSSFGKFTREVFVGLSPHLCPNKRHGTISFNGGDSELIHLNFIVDKPDRLAEKPRYSLNDIVDQVFIIDPSFTRQYHTPVFVDLLVGGFRRVYEYPSLKVILEQEIV